MVRLALLTTCFALALAVPATGADADGAPACRVLAPIEPACDRSWASGNRFMIRGTTVRERKQVEWHYAFAGNRDLKLDIRIDSDAATTSGALLLIDRNTMLVHGLAGTRGQEFDTLSAPVLALQLVVDLLERAMPGGPDALTEGRTIEIADDRKPLTIAAGSAVGLVPAPWKLSGSVSRGTESRVEFDLKLSFRPLLDGAQAEEMHISGIWDKRSYGPLLPDSKWIEGWAIHQISRYSDTEASRTLTGFRTIPVPNSFKTLGALRRHISNDEAEEAR